MVDFIQVNEINPLYFLEVFHLPTCSMLTVKFDVFLFFLFSSSSSLFLYVFCPPLNRTTTILATAFFFVLLLPSWSTTFNVDPDTHIDSIEQAEAAVLEGTANWSAKIAVTGRHNPIQHSNEIDANSYQFELLFWKCFVFARLFFYNYYYYHYYYH